MLLVRVWVGCFYPFTLPPVFFKEAASLDRTPAAPLLLNNADKKLGLSCMKAEKANYDRKLMSMFLPSVACHR